MFIDASAIVAILNREARYEDLVRRGGGDHECQLFTSPMVRFEASISLARALREACAVLVSEFVVEISACDIHVTTSIGDGALQAAEEYCRIVGHPADLNFGDCFAYACARADRLKLIYTGGDFVQTDLA